MSAIRKALRTIGRNERGATAIEYGLIAGLIAAACIGGMTMLGGGATGLWGKIETNVSAALK